MGLGVGLGLELGIGLGIGLGMGLGIGLGIALGVGLGLGIGLGLGLELREQPGRARRARPVRDVARPLVTPHGAHGTLAIPPGGPAALSRLLAAAHGTLVIPPAEQWAARGRMVGGVTSGQRALLAMGGNQRLAERRGRPAG